MKLAIIGAGAMGSLLAYFLCEQAEVWLIDAWQEPIEIINRHGLRYERDGVESVRYPHAATDPAAVGPCDAVLVLVKAHQTAWAAEQARSLLVQAQQPTDDLPSPGSSLQPSAVCVTLQNGVGNRELLAEYLGEASVGQGVTALGATLLGPGRVRHAGQGATTFGSAPNQAQMVVLAQLFSSCSLPATLSDDIDGLVWGKLVVNAGINALTALLRVPNGALPAHLETRVLLDQVVAEAVAVAAARGTALPYADPLAHVLHVAETTGANRSSMLQDALRGSPTEITTINGAIVREGQRLGVPTPINALLVALVQALDATTGVRVRDREQARGDKGKG